VIRSRERPWVPSSVDAWYARLADEIAGLGPAATVDYVERLAARQERRTDYLCVNLNAATNVMSPRARALLVGRWDAGRAWGIRGTSTRRGSPMRNESRSSRPNLRAPSSTPRSWRPAC